MKSTFLIVFAGSTLLQKAMNPPKDETCLCCFFRYFMFFPLIFNVFISSFRLFSARMSFFRFCSPRTKSSVRSSPEDIIWRFQVIGCSDQICQPKKYLDWFLVFAVQFDNGGTVCIFNIEVFKLWR